jgi:alkanesulfonate monooxygenase SsuD/methylene tetrahydromethanopterin reductase-like flavin-dependent oxidoreductase (luciferase family)
VRVTLFLNQRSPGPESDHANIESIIEQAIEADAAGFSAIFVTEHHFNGINSYTDPTMFGSYLAGRLTQAYLGTAAIQMTNHHPLRVAEYANILDVLTKGRCIVGLGAGGVSAGEYEALGIDMARRREITEQRMAVLHRILAHQPGDGPLDCSTEFDEGVLTGRVVPLSYRRPHPLMARATATDETILELGERGWPVMFGLVPSRRQLDLYEDGLARGEHSEETLAECRRWIAQSRYIWVGETDAEAWAQAGDAVTELAARSGHLKMRVDGVEQPIFAGPQDFIDRTVIVGSPETVHEKILASRDELGIDHVRTWFKFGDVDLGELQRSFRLFTSEVLPRLDPERLPGPPAPAAAVPTAG